ncbi:hypothetical protein ACQPXS_02580 [Streptomyces sp. CA-142005]|uniref:hypothetical protein n=1 Tax=Streptomyces sp. CA-142005 TaxID=3240052 RepID=UPI003D8D4009
MPTPMTATRSDRFTDPLLTNAFFPDHDGEWQPGVRLGWSGLGPGLHFYHAWVQPEHDTTIVTTEQAARGATAITMRASRPKWEDFLRYGRLDALKQRAEVR